MKREIHKKITLSIIVIIILFTSSIGLYVLDTAIHEAVHVYDFERADYACVAFTPLGTESIGNLTGHRVAGLAYGYSPHKVSEFKAYGIASFTTVLLFCLISVFLIYCIIKLKEKW